MSDWINIILIAVNLIITVSAIFMIKKIRTNNDNDENKDLKLALAKIEKDFTSLSSGLNIIMKQFSDEMQRNRVELSESQTAMRKEMSESMNHMNAYIAKMTRESYEHRVNMTEALGNSLENIRKNNIEQNERQSRIISEAIGNMQQSNERKLDQMRETVDEKLTATLTTRLDSSFKTVSDQLENVYKSLGEMKELSTGVTDNVASLNRVLTNVKARGTWAEVQLEGILEQTIPGMFDTNVATDPKSSARVEFAVKIPSGDGEGIIYLPIDSKFPMEDYIRLCDATDKANTDAITIARKALEVSVTNKAKEITKYINVPKTTPFAIMYLATEGLYAEVASSKNGLQEKLHSNYNIMVAGPSTITALLNSLSMGFRAVAINEKATEVRNLLAAAKSQYNKFGDLLDKAKRKVDEAGKALGEAQNRNRIITKKLKTVDAIDYSESDKILGIDDINDIFDDNIQEVQNGEM